MIDYQKIADDIVAICQHAFLQGDPLLSKRIEDKVRKVGHVEHMEGYIERQREEHARHENLREQLAEARNRFNVPQVG